LARCGHQDGNTLQYTESEKDIGVTIDEKISFNKHISEKVNKANSIMGLIRRNMEYMDNNSFKLLYTALVRPHIEYANQVWCPHLAKHKDEIENVQRRATKELPGMSNFSYPERLQKLKLPTLQLSPRNFVNCRFKNIMDCIRQNHTYKHTMFVIAIQEQHLIIAVLHLEVAMRPKPFN
jgi:hypothetical protein